MRRRAEHTSHGAAPRTKSYTASPPGAAGSSHPCLSSHSTLMADLSQTLARYPVRASPVNATPDAPGTTFDAPIVRASRSSAATTSSRPGWHVA